MRRLTTAILVLMCAASCAHRVKTAPVEAQAKCASWDALDPGSRSAFALESCSTLEPETWDAVGAILGERGKPCSVAGVQFVGKPESDHVLDSFAEITQEGKPAVTVRPEPRATQSFVHAAPVLAVACDTEVPRFYMGNGYLGYIVAYDPDGTELWRVSLPEFQTIIGKPIPASSLGITRLIDSEGGVLADNLSVMGQFIAANYRVKGRWYQAMIHRSGVVVAILGPWDGILEHATANGWTFAAGGEAANKYWKLPTEELALRLTAKGPEPLIDHFLSWMLPQPQDTTFTLRKCLGNERFVRLDLGPRFDLKTSDAAMEIHDGLGVDWAARLLENPAMQGVLSRGDLSYHDWKAAVRQALLAAGADVAAVKYAREHGLLPAPLDLI